ncbi:MAG: hypothetical protein AAGF23_27645, partial [Acidobacteriota bacterium]
GTLISPGRGLFVYSPIFFFSIVGAALLIRQKRWRLLESCVAAILVLHWLAISSWKIWWGGTVFGPRLFADMVPFLLFFLLPVLERLAVPGGRRLALAAGLAASIAVSAFIHRSGAIYWATGDWNIEPVSVDEHPERLWHWGDPPFLRRDDAAGRSVEESDLEDGPRIPCDLLVGGHELNSLRTRLCEQQTVEGIFV